MGRGNSVVLFCFKSYIIQLVFNLFSDNLDEGIECTLSKFVDNTEEGGWAVLPLSGTLIGWGAGQRNLMKFNKGKCKVLGGTTPNTSTGWG